VDDALALLQKVAMDHPADLTGLEALFDVQMTRKDFAGARHTAELARVAKPDAPAGNYLAGLVDLADGKSDAARADFEQAAATTPAAIEPVSALVRLDLSQQHTDAALARLEQMISKFPKNPLLHNLKGEVLVRLKRTDAAVASFREAINLSPAWPTPYANIASTQWASGQKDEAIATLTDGVKASNGTPALVTDLASLDEKAGKPDVAIAEYEAFLKRDPDSPVAANNLAMLLVTYHTDKVSLDRARALSQRFANSREAGFADTWGWVLYKTGENADALNALQKAVAQSPRAAVLRYHLAMAQLKSGDRDAARTNLQQALNSAAVFTGSDEAKRTLTQLTQ
jgi:Flp pilus assembly protein TadD